MIKNFKIFIFLFFSASVFAQSPTLDSLKSLLKTKLHDTVHINILAQMVEVETNDSLWPLYNETLKEKCESFLRSASKDHPLRLFYLRHLSGALNNIGFLANQKGDVQTALFYFNQSLSYKDETGDKRGMAVCYSNIGVIFDNQGDIPQALEYYGKSLKILEEINDKKGMATTLNNLGTVYDSQGDNEKAMEFYERSLKAYKEIDDKEGIGIILNNIGFIYSKKGNYIKAGEYYNQSMKIRAQLQDKLGMATTFNNLGIVHKSEGDTLKALKDYKMSLKLSEEIDDPDGISYALNGIATTLLQLQKWEDAKAHAERGLNLAKKLGYPQSIRDLSVTLSKIYAKTQNWKGAFDMQVLFKQMSDSLNNEKNKKASIQKAFQYEYEKKLAADSIRTAEERKVHAAQIKEERTQRFALYGGLLLVIIFSVFIFTRFRITQKQKNIIEMQKKSVDHAYELLNEKNKEVLDSIRYAKRIQNALLPREKYISYTLRRIQKEKN